MFLFVDYINISNKQLFHSIFVRDSFWHDGLFEIIINNKLTKLCLKIIKNNL